MIKGERMGGSGDDSEREQQRDEGVQTITRSKPKVKRPRQYRVLLINDDFTTMDFVVKILEQVFRKSPAEAVQIMLQVHRRGQGVAGVYTKEIAEAKIVMVHDRAREAGYPLRCIMEEA